MEKQRFEVEDFVVYASSHEQAVQAVGLAKQNKSEYYTTKSEQKVGGKVVTMLSPDYTKKGK